MQKTTKKPTCQASDKYYKKKIIIMAEQAQPNGNSQT